MIWKIIYFSVVLLVLFCFCFIFRMFLFFLRCILISINRSDQNKLDRKKAYHYK